MNTYEISQLIPICVLLSGDDIRSNLMKVEYILDREYDANPNAVTLLTGILDHADNPGSVLSTIKYIGEFLVANNEKIIKPLSTIIGRNGGDSLLVTNLKNALEKAVSNNIDPYSALVQISKITSVLSVDAVANIRSLIGILSGIEELEEVVKILNAVPDPDMPSHLYRARSEINDPLLFKNMVRAIRKSTGVRWEDVFSQGQFESKKWLLQELLKLNLDLGTVYVVGGWVGSLSYMIKRSDLRFSKIRSFDIDQECAAVAEAFNHDMKINEWEFKAQTYDMFEMQYDRWCYETIKGTAEHVQVCDNPGAIINTSTEHIDHQAWLDLIPSGKLVIMQNNNYKEIEDHINTHDSIEDFINRSQLSKVLYSGTLSLPAYDRYMVIGYK